jgi:hypothetical protein
VESANADRLVHPGREQEMAGQPGRIEPERPRVLRERHGLISPERRPLAVRREEADSWCAGRLVDWIGRRGHASYPGETLKIGWLHGFVPASSR